MFERGSVSFQKHYKQDFPILAERKENILASLPFKKKISIFNTSFLARTNHVAEFWLNKANKNCKKKKKMLCYFKNVWSKCCVKPCEKSCGFIFNLGWHTMTSWSKNLFAKTRYSFCATLQISQRWRCVMCMKVKSQSFREHSAAFSHIFRFFGTAAILFLSVGDLVGKLFGRFKRVYVALEALFFPFYWRVAPSSVMLPTF